MLLLWIPAGPPALGAEIDDLPEEVRSMIECVWIDWTGIESVWIDWTGGAEKQWPARVVFGAKTPARPAVAPAEAADEPAAGLGTVSLGFGIVPEEARIPEEYWRLAGSIVKEADEDLAQLAELPIGTRMLVAVHLAREDRQDAAQALTDTVSQETFLALPQPDRGALSCFVNNAIREEYERRNRWQRGKELYELFRRLATEPYGREHIHFWGGKCYDRLKEYGKAEACYRKTLHLLGTARPDSPNYSFIFHTLATVGLGYCLNRRGAYAEAVPMLLAINVDERRAMTPRVQADNILNYIAKKTGLPRGVAPSE